MYAIHSSQDRFMKEYGIPEGVEVTNIPHDGTPFSAYTILTRGDKSLEVRFGVGGYYSDVAMDYIKDYFMEETVAEPEVEPATAEVVDTLSSGNPKPILRTKAVPTPLTKTTRGTGNTHVVMDNLTIVDGHTWHTQKARRHTFLYIGSQQECLQWKEAYIQEMLA